MTQRTLRRALSAAAVCAALPALAPALASASTYTVDDDRTQCPSAGFTSIQAAVDQAAPWDTIIVCDGLYQEQSTPASGTGSPSQAGSLNGLTITKPLTIRGTGAGKVTIEPVQSNATLAGTAPYLRDGGGNVITISRQSRDATDMNTMFVDISGVTVTSGTTYAEAGVAFFNTSGAIRDSVVGPLVRASDSSELAARPHGWGVVATSYYLSAEAGPRHEVTLDGTLVTGYQSGGVLFDTARGTDGSADTLTRTGQVLYGTIKDSSVVGAGADTLIPQTGVEYHAGARGAISLSSITGNLFTTDQRRSVGVLLTDAETGVDPVDPSKRAFSISDSTVSGNGWGLFNATADNSAVSGRPAAASLGYTGSEVYWGCRTGAVIGGQSAGGCDGVSGSGSVETGFARTVAPVLATAPAATVDAAPTATFAEPSGGAIVAGEAFVPNVAARDDFGVSAVTYSIDGVAQPALTRPPYEFAGWTPGFDEIGERHELEATVTDSSGQATTATVTATVVAPAGYVPASLDSRNAAFGDVTLGASATRTVTLTNSGENPLTLGPLTTAGGGFSVSGGSCLTGSEYAPGASCTVIVGFAPASAGAATGTLTLPYTAIGGGEPLVVALSGAGVAATVPPPALVPPISTSAPRIGAARVGRTVTCSPGSWSGEPTSFAYQWLRGGAAIGGATRVSYTPVLADTGARLTCAVVAANAAGAGAAATSTAVTVAFATVRTKTTVAKQLGTAVVTFTKAPKARKGSLTVATVRAYGTGSRIYRATGTLVVGTARFACRASRRVAAGKRAAFVVKLSAKARRALAKRGGTLTLKVAAGGASTSQKLSVKRG